MNAADDWLHLYLAAVLTVLGLTLTGGAAPEEPTNTRRDLPAP